VADRPLNIDVELLADRSDLLIPLARMRWNEWGSEPGREELQFWIDITEQESGRAGLPVTFVASSSFGGALGGVGLVAVEYPELADRGSPWVVGTIVRGDRRGQGVGRALMSHLIRWGLSAGIDQIWVATGGPAIGFYRACGFEIVEEVRLADGAESTVLTARW
jgi:GNAT superfamily N-acetyltransferase